MALFRITVGKGNSCLVLSPRIPRSAFPSVLKYAFSYFPAALWSPIFQHVFQFWEVRGCYPEDVALPAKGRVVGSSGALPERAAAPALIWLFVFSSCLFVVFNALTSLWLGEPICHSNGNLCLAIGLTAAQPWSTMIKLWKLCLCSSDQWNLQAFLLHVPKHCVAVPWLAWQIFLDYRPCQYCENSFVFFPPPLFFVYLFLNL